jgi:BASS family bile acid:Na+ symporter
VIVVWHRPKPVIAGYASQYIAKPLLGAMIARAFRIPEAFASGFVLMACVAGAQLSSYATYLSDGDVALSIVLTSLSTITSVIVTPLLTGLLIGSVVPVDGIAMAKSILQVL